MREYLNTQPRPPERPFRYRIVGDGKPIQHPLAALFVYRHRYPNHRWQVCGVASVECELCGNTTTSGSLVHLASFCPIEIVSESNDDSTAEVRIHQSDDGTRRDRVTASLHD